MSERTFTALKPDAIERGLVGSILARFERRGLTVQHAETIEATDELLAVHYEEHVDEDYYDGLVAYMQERPVLAVEIVGESAVSVARNQAGETDPVDADPGTIRGDFGTDSFDTADAEGRAVRNLVHTAENKTAAKRELSLWFADR